MKSIQFTCISVFRQEQELGFRDFETCSNDTTQQQSGGTSDEDSDECSTSNATALAAVSDDARNERHPHLAMDHTSGFHGKDMNT
jgi:hypothetical protein